jgi:transcriptional regulator CtsR
LGNLADIIEQFILSKMTNGNDDIVILQRNEIAEEIDCAPSQVSYVLSTRFTVDRGFIVESRRGSGGFIRIARIPLQNIIFEDAAEQISETTTIEEIKYITRHLNKYGFLTIREARLLVNFYGLIFKEVEPAKRATMMKELLSSLAYL